MTADPSSMRQIHMSVQMPNNRCILAAGPQNWNTYNLGFVTTWLQAHVNVCRQLGKPCILGEVQCWWQLPWHLACSCSSRPPVPSRHMVVPNNVSRVPCRT